ncbi:DUF4397 domain-containing protein [Roseateles sp. UC29_93]|uniref:DUF4397 domain-containing protein n=1 Tax=Roseateles sp. UC29_93 TaxID=3350177 RepID=UPI0036727692
MHIPDRTTRWLMPLGVIAATLLTAACNGGDDKDAQIRLLNASPELASADLAVDKDKVAGPVSALTLGSYANRGDGPVSLQVLNSNGSATVATSPATLKADTHYTLIAYGPAGAVRTSLLEEEQEAPVSGQSKLLVLNVAPDAGPVDVFLTEPAADPADAPPFATNVLAGGSSGFLMRSSGTYRLRVTGAGKRDDVRLDLPAVTLDSAKVSTLVLRGGAGGVLVHALMLPQRGELTRLDNASARVRMIAAMPDGRVDGALGGQPLLAGQASPTIGDYRMVPASAPSLTASVDGRPVAATLPALVAGGDYTVLLRGVSATPVVTVLTDDNRLPAVPGQARLRLVNGLDISTTMNFDYSPVVAAVDPGSSGYATVEPASAALLTVTSTQSIAPLYAARDVAIGANGVYAVFVAGDPAAPAGILRRER